MSRTPLSTSGGSSSKLRKESTVAKVQNATVDDEAPSIMPSMGKGWTPFPREQKFRSLNRGPLYDPSTFPIIPAPFLEDLDGEGIGGGGDAGGVTHSDVDGGDAARYPPYRLVDPLPEVPDDDEDEPYAAPLPTACSYSIVDLLGKLGNPDELLETVDEDMKDVAVTHEAIIAMFQLGKPKGMAEATFCEAVEEMRNVLARQRALFPSKRPVQAAPTKKQSSLGKKQQATPSNVFESNASAAADEDNGGIVKVGNPRSAVVLYDDPLLMAARDLLHRPTAGAPPPQSVDAHETAAPSSAAADPIATWSYDDQIMTAQKILKKSEMLRKKQQLFVGYGRSVVFSRVDLPNADVAVPRPVAFRVDVQKNPPAASEGERLGQSTLGQSVVLDNSITTNDADARTDGDTPQVAEGSGAWTEFPRISTMPSQDLNGSSFERQPAEGSSSQTVSPLIAASSVAVHGTRDGEGRYVVPVKNCGDPKTMKLLDKCEWEGEPLSDAFDTISNVDANPSSVLATDPLLWMERAREAARRGRYDAVAPADVRIVQSFTTSAAQATSEPLSTKATSIGAAQTSGVRGAKVSRPTPFVQSEQLQTNQIAQGTTSPPVLGGQSSMTAVDAMLVASASSSAPLVPPSERNEAVVATTDGIQIDAPGKTKSSLALKASQRADAEPQTPTEIAGSGPEGHSKKSKDVLTRPPKSGRPPPPASSGTPQVSTPTTEAADATTPPERIEVLASLFGGASGAPRLPHNLPPLTVVFPAFFIAAPLVLPVNDGANYRKHDDDVDAVCTAPTTPRRTLVTFQQARSFYLRPPRDHREAGGEGDNDFDGDDEEDEFWDDAVELLQEDMQDEHLVPPTPPSTPVKWSPPAPEASFVPAPFTQMIIDRLEAGIATPKGSSSDDDDDDGDKQQPPLTGGDAPPKPNAAPSLGDATGTADERQRVNQKKKAVLDVGEDGLPTQTRHSEAALQTMRALDEEVRQRTAAAVSLRREAMLLEMRGLNGSDGSGLDGDARERTLERYLTASKNNVPTRSEPLLLATRLPMRMEGTTSVVRRLMRRSKKDVLALAKKSKEAQLVGFRPSRRFLAEIMRLRSFGNLVVALLSNPDDPVPEEAVTVSLDDLGQRLQMIWEASPADTRAQLLLSATGNGTERDRRGARVWWQGIRDMLADIHRRATVLSKRQHRHANAPGGASWANVVAISAASGDAENKEETGPLAGRRASSSMGSTRRRHSSVRASGRVVDETVLLRGSPFLPHFLPTPSGPLHAQPTTGQLADVRGGRSASTPPTTQPTRLAALRRMPRDVTMRGGLDNAYDDPQGQAQRFLRSSGGIESSKRTFAGAKTASTAHATRTGGSVPLQRGGLQTVQSVLRHPTQTPASPLRATILYPLPVEFQPTASQDNTRDGVLVLPDVHQALPRAVEWTRLQKDALRQLHQEWFSDMHDARTSL